MAVNELSGGILADCARELLCLTTPAREVVAAVGPWGDVIGHLESGLAGRRLEELVDDDDRPALRALHEAAVRGVPSPKGDVSVTDAGRTRIYDVALRAVDGYVAASFRDVTQQRRAERLLDSANQQLRSANDELRRSNDELQRFAYVASHDLSEPLRMVTSYCALLVSECGDQLDDTAREYLAFAADGAVRMRTLIDDLLSYSRVSWEVDEAEPVDLREVFANAVRDLGPLIAETHAQIAVDALPTVVGSASQLGQLATNLLANAVKFRSSAVTPLIRVSATCTRGEVTLTVSDNGIGVPNQHRARIFVMFKRLHSRGMYTGNGIGLALCKRIAEQHHGRIWVDDGVDGGSAFHVTLRAFTTDHVALVPPARTSCEAVR